MDNKEMLSAEQCRAARGLLNWSQNELATRVRMRKASISDFERGVTNPLRKNLEDIRAAFEEVGIRFENNDDEILVKLLKK